MRAIIILYFVIGLGLLVIGFVLPGGCTNRNTDIVSHIVFVVTWPVGLYAEVYRDHKSVRDWLRAQACEGGGGLGGKKNP